MSRATRVPNVAVIVFALGTVGLLRSHQYYGTLLFGWDAQFYYAAARSLAVSGDADVSDDLALTPVRGPFDSDGDGFLEQLPRRGGRVLNKYTIGLTLVEVGPIFAGTRMRDLAVPDDRSAPGYGDLEVALTALTLLALFALGCQQLQSLLVGIAPPWWAGASILAAWFGTTQFHYTAVFPFMTHGVAFALIIGLINAISSASRAPQANRALALAGALGGMLFLVRPQHATLVFVVLPALIGVARRPFREWVSGGLTAAAAVAAALMLQMVVNHAQTGTWTLSAYAAGGEHFNWTAPDWGVVLVSGSRGLLTITPLVLVGLAGYLVGWGRANWAARVLLVHSLIQLYLIAAWSSPEQGESFGSRMWGENLGAVSAGLALWYRARPSARFMVALCAIGSVVWTMTLLSAYIRGLIPHPLPASALLTLVSGAFGW